MSFAIQGKDDARRRALASIDQLEARFARNVETLVREVDAFIKAKTPVHTGSAVRNYNWSVGAPDMSYNDPIDNGPPGHTNRMALGTEPRRKPNEEAAAQSLTGLNFGNPFQTFILNNTDPDIGGLEMGLLPGPPLTSRSPNGMFGITQAYFSAKIAAKGMLK